MDVADGRRRVVVEGLMPEVDGGRTPIKRIAGDTLVVEADIFADGHDAVAAVLLFRRSDTAAWSEVPMIPIGDDRWRGELSLETPGTYLYVPQGWIDRFATWRQTLEKRVRAGEDVSVDLEVGVALVAGAARRAGGAEGQRLAELGMRLRGGGLDPGAWLELRALMDRNSERPHVARYPVELAVSVERPRAACGAWYEVFPRSWAAQPGRHGTLADLADRLPYVAGMGFDVVYLTPVHPIGRTRRRGRNNGPAAQPADPGSPWAIGSEAGGHTAIHPELGSLADFDRLRARAADLGLEVAMDLAFQCSPDHPYVREHPEWFRHWPDGTIRCAENPPKRYEDIYPFDFECDAWRELWAELLAVTRFWVRRGVRIFRVDNPHTKPFAFWAWLIADIRRDDPGVIFLAEAFTRPKVMRYLAKAGFSQSYTYFAWRNGRQELVDYLTELTGTEVAEYLRPNLWPNTPDILTDYLQTGGRPAFAVRLVLAATLGASYGIYGPAFELCESRALAPGSEEYLDSEKYQVRVWPAAGPSDLVALITRVNRIRHDEACLCSDRGLRFLTTDNDRLISYCKSTPDLDAIVLTVVNLNPYGPERGWVDVPLRDLGLDPAVPYQMHDLLGGARYTWQGPRGYVFLDPQRTPAHIFRVRRQLRREEGFDYYA